MWLITGGCGFIGTNLADALLADRQDVTVLDNFFRQGSRANLAWLKERHGNKLRFVEADVRQAAAIDKAVSAAEPAVVAHLAGQVAMTTSIENPRLDFETNALGTLNVLEAVRRNAPKATVLFSSTNKVYGDLASLAYRERPSRHTAPDLPQGMDETLPLDFHSPYGCSKGAADQYVLDYHRMFGLNSVVFRHSSIYGGRQFATYDQGWVGWFCLKILEQKQAALKGRPVEPFTISGDGKQVRDLLHADDIVSCYRQAVAGIGKCAGRAYNIGGGMANSLSLLELFMALEDETGHVPVYTRLSARLSDQKVFVADTRAAVRDFQWKPQVSRQDGLRRMLSWITQMEASGSEKSKA